MGTFVKTHTNLDFNEKVIAELLCTVNRSIEIGLHVARLCFVKINSTVTRLYFFCNFEMYLIKITGSQQNFHFDLNQK